MAKGPDAFRTISEAAEELVVPQHVLRFWETKFSFIRPMKRAGGRRFYRPADVTVLRGVKILLHDRGYTIKGVQRLYREEGLKRLIAAAGGEPEAAAPATAPLPRIDPSAPLSDAARERLTSVLSDLLSARARLEELLRP